MTPASTVPLPPQNLEAEEYVLGAMMLSSHAIEACLDVVAPGDFYRESHGLIFQACLRLYASGQPCDAVTVTNELDVAGDLERVGGKDRIREIATLAPVWSNAAHHARIVREQAVRRDLTVAGDQIQQLGRDGGADGQQLLDQAEGFVFQVAAQRRTVVEVTLRDAMDSAFARAEAAHAAGQAVVGLATGFSHLDALTAGIQPGNLVVLAARPSMGKSAFALAVAINKVREQLPVAFFTLEMGEGEIADRIICAEGGIENRSLRTGQLDKDEWGRAAAVTARMRDLPLLIEPASAVTALELRSRARRLKMRHKNLALIVVDYLQLMTSGQKSDSRTQDVSQISRALKMLAGELEVPVIAVSQLSRAVEARHEKRPELRDLRESGQIEADADLVMMLYRDEVYNAEDAADLGTEGVCEVIVAKHRNGPLGTVRLAFVKKYARFTDLAQL